MSTMTRVFIVLTSVVAIVVSCLFVAAAAQWTNTKETVERYQALYQSEFVQRQNALGVMAVSLAMKDDAVNDKTALLTKSEEEKRRLTDDLATLRIDLARQTNERVAAEAGRKKLEEILDVQTAERTSLQKQNQEFLSQNADLQTRNQRLASRVLELTSQMTIATDEMRNLQEKLYAAEQKYKEIQQAQAAPRRAAEAEAPRGAQPVKAAVAGPIRGEIVELDGRYVSLNVGDTSGVVPGMVFIVYRGDTYVGDLEIETVRSKECGGKVTLVAPGQAVQRGDRVVYE